MDTTTRNDSVPGRTQHSTTNCRINHPAPITVARRWNVLVNNEDEGEEEEEEEEEANVATLMILSFVLQYIVSLRLVG